MGYHDRHFAGDAFAHTGVWGNPTSVENFCEEDYAVTRFVAEFVNSITNLTYVYFALKCRVRVRNGMVYSGGFDSLSVTLMLVGVTSTAYHATLHQGPQLADDLSMLLLAGALLQKLCCSSEPPVIARLAAVSIWLPTFIISTMYIKSGNFLLHMWMFGTMAALIGLRIFYLIYFEPRPEQDKTRLAFRFWNGAAYLVVAFAVWNIDLERCHQLRAARQRLGLPWAWLLELHGWWHVLTAIGAARFIELVRDLCDQTAGSKRRESRELLSSESTTRKRGFAVLTRMMLPALTKESKDDLDRIGSTG
ncbi:ceramidase-domain-containing protein [Truncatella angustata]|uniref:Ceramidase-domain-containing protein n=1 Tax=Truncatella angustata TaxID=152316 RepID=A0A9P8UK98_9PEZI|nr:ceramidase-domain-containing protein [Truncatella angustata]KAH6654070.1 ceramidase-domain-containing protein [Truncatella angustata]